MLASDNLDDKNPTGLPILIKAYELHRDNAEVVEAIVTVIQEFCEYGTRSFITSFTFNEKEKA